MLQHWGCKWACCCSCWCLKRTDFVVVNIPKQGADDPLVSLNRCWRIIHIIPTYRSDMDFLFFISATRLAQYSFWSLLIWLLSFTGVLQMARSLVLSSSPSSSAEIFGHKLRLVLQILAILGVTFAVEGPFAVFMVSGCFRFHQPPKLVTWNKGWCFVNLCWRGHFWRCWLNLHCYICFRWSVYSFSLVRLPCCKDVHCETYEPPYFVLALNTSLCVWVCACMCYIHVMAMETDGFNHWIETTPQFRDPQVL